MSVVHYMHRNKLWYYWIDESEQTRYYGGILHDAELFAGSGTTEHQARIILQEKFPEHKIMKALPFHDSPSNTGSRPIKETRDRKKQRKEKVSFLDELTKNMRDATPEEMQSVEERIDSISRPTGVIFWEVVEHD